MTNNIGISTTNEIAQGANKLPLDVYGQTTNPVSIQCKTSSGYKTLHLGIMIVVANLGIACLVGEPGKAHNNLICLPQKKLIIFGNEHGQCQAPYVTNDSQYTLARAVCSVVILPGEQINFELPQDLKYASHVAISPRPGTVNWLLPKVHEVFNGQVCLTNSSPNPVTVKKADHLADIRDTTPFPSPRQSNWSKNFNHPDKFQYAELAPRNEDPNTYLHLLQVDPDNVLSNDDKEIFHVLHRRFAHLFTPQPGRYNGNYGHVDNQLQFSSPPPPNSKTHIPNY